MAYFTKFTNLVIYNSDVIIVFSATDIRLVDGNFPYEGRLEIKQNNAYSAVCASNFNAMGAMVVCSMLGFNNPYVTLSC